MKTNKEVVMAFWRGESAHNGSLKSTRIKLFSYNTVIAQHDPFKGTIINNTKYSSTTTRHLRLIPVWERVDLHYLNDIPINTQDLTEHL